MPNNPNLKPCKLCSQEYPKLARSHILSKGFFRRISTGAKVESFQPGGDPGRRLPNAMWDANILCTSCEHSIMEPLDDYGIAVLRDRKASMKIELSNNPPLSLVLYDDLNRRQLKAFIASVLWRVSVSQQKEVSALTIGPEFEHRIALDLLSKGTEDFAYIDVVANYLTDIRHNAFFLPINKQLSPKDAARDKEPVNTWLVQLPNIQLSVALDNNPHPHRLYCSLSTDVSNLDHDIPMSQSLNNAESEYSWMVVETEISEPAIQSILSAINNRTTKRVR